MWAEKEIPVLAFVWRPGDLNRPVREMAQRTGTRAIFDLSEMGAEAAPSFLKTAGAAGQISDVRLSAAALMDPSVGRLLKASGVQNIWVECHPRLLTCETSALLQRLRDVSADFRCFPIVGDVSLLAALIKEGAGIGRVVLKGCEASGFVSGETALALYGAAKQMRNDASASPDLFIWGGVATPEAAAAFLSTGAAGIVFESVHWLTDLVALDDLQRRQLARLRMDSTALVGLDLQVPCRLFNKGNSLAFKRLQALEDSLCAADVTDESRRDFSGHVQAGARHALDSQFTPDEVIPLGVEAAFASSFAERFGTGTEQAVTAFMAETRKLCGVAATKRECFLDSPVARELGIKYPFIQGAMSSITDSPEYAAAIADAGGLPTLALGLMDAQALDRRLGRLPEIMGARPYAVNVVSLAENPFRETHLAWIKRHGPRFVWIAGGDLSPVRELLQGGIGVVYIAPDEALMKLALEAGVRYVVCEGYEAGGHVGQHSTLALAQMALDLKRRQPDLFEGCRVILAGGIFNRETAFMACLLGADAVQMGTAYLATREIVETGALAALYQRMIVESQPGGTVVSGQSTGLRVRSLRTPRAAAIAALERAFAAGHHDEPAFRAKIEEMTAGSLCVAARGVDRQNGRALDEQACLERGQFMSGACAGLIGQVQSLESFHRELAEGPLVLCQPFVAESVMVAVPSIPENGRRPGGTVPRVDRDRVAITGMSVINALGKSPEEVWEACVALKSGVTLVPTSRWDHDLFYDPRPRMADKTYCRVGAFVDFHVSRTELGIPPQDFRTMTTATRNTMWLAQNAIRDAGLLESGIPRERIAVIISQNSGEAAHTLTDLIMRGRVHETIAAIKRAMPLTPEQECAIIREVKSERMAADDTTLLGRLNCTAAGFICNRYGFMGPSYAVSAACATSLVALYSALQMIRNGIIDAAIVGGSEETLTHLHFLEFSALGALYGLSGRPRPPHEASRPFDAERDGLVLGEGGGMIVIERESIARTRGAPVHAVITGMGASNNHLGMVESSRVTQEIAMRASFRGLPYGPEAVDLVECHGTSTRQGDGEEVRALSALYDPSKRTVLTSFKSQIGHTLGASGINNLIRGTLAMKAGVLPPTLNYRHPDPEIDLEGAGFRIAPEPCDWPRRAGQPRRFQVNAFGFGGSNYVVQVEQALDGEDAVPLSTGFEDGRVAEAGESPAVPLGVSFFRTATAGRACRVAVVAASDDEALAALERSASLVEDAVASPHAARALTQQGLFLSPEDSPAPPLALVFPGQGAHYAGMGLALYESFPVIREWMARAAAAADFDLLHLLFHDREENLQKTRWQQPALFTLEYAVARYLVALGIRPVALAGHSLGELTALCLAGVYSLEDGFRIVNKRALCMDKAAALHGDPGVMAATDTPLELLKEIIQEVKDVHIGNINSPGQVILSGNTDAVKMLGASLKAKGYRFTLLRVSMAFHSPIMRVIRDELAAFVASIPFHAPQIPVISNTTKIPYPSDPAEIRRILMAHLESPVHWMDNVQTLWNDYGVRHFLEVGPGDVLSGLIADTLPEPLCLQTCLPGAEGDTFRTALAQLFVRGHLRVREEPRFVALPISRPAPGSSRLTDTPAASVVPAPAETMEHVDNLEEVIRIIMEATGFNRDEIQADMDLRRDLSVRSSRLPIIMDAAERQFKITIELEDFIHVRTVRDIAQRVTAIIARNETPEGQTSVQTDASVAASDTPTQPADEEPLKRLIFSLTPVVAGAPAPLELRPGEAVLLLSPNGDDSLAKHAGAALRQAYGVDTVPFPYVPGHAGPPDAANHASGLVIALRQDTSVRSVGLAEVSRLLAGLAECLKDFLQSPARKFVVLIHDREDADTPVGLLAEGLLGLFLSAAQEYPAVEFRTLEIDRDADLSQALRAALDKGCATVELICREGALFTSQAHLAPAVVGGPSSLELNPGDVVVMSGGASGISAHLARSLAPFAPRLVFLGRTRLEPRTEPSRADEIAQTLADLHAAGIEATYLTCDVADPEAVRAALGEVIARYGRIDGIIHGAGVLRDGFLDQMAPEDFSLVVDIKFMGAWNLFSAAVGAGLRFFAGLSSVAAIQGNPGQTNYAAANRMLSALLRHLRRTHGTIRFKALMLPPVEGAGMAEAPEVRDMLRRRGVAYVHVKELAGLFCRELFATPADDDWVMFARTLPPVKTAPLGEVGQPAPGGLLACGPAAFSPQEFPMIDGITSLDLRREQVEATLTFSRQNDLWLEDHRPLKSLAHPLVSAVMLVETFMESARLLFPHLQVRGVRQVRFLDMIACPPGVPRPARVSCRRVGADLREVVCEASLSVQEISPAGRLAERFSPHCTGQVLLGGSRGERPEEFQDFPVRPEELRTPPVSHEQVLEWYGERTGLAGRYRVLQSIDGAGPEVIRGRTAYPETRDFAHLPDARYQYSPYLFEALMQVAGFHMLAMNPQDRRSMLPMEIGELRFLRPCRPGEAITLEARLRSQDQDALVWDAQGLDTEGRAIMQVRAMRMHWVTP